MSLRQNNTLDEVFFNQILSVILNVTVAVSNYHPILQFPLTLQSILASLAIFSLLFWFYSQQLNSQVEPLSSHQPLVLVKEKPLIKTDKISN